MLYADPIAAEGSLRLHEHVCLESGELLDVARPLHACPGPRYTFVSPGRGCETEFAFSADHRLTVRLTREMWALESRHIGLARDVSAVAHDFGAVADRAAVQEIQVAIAAKPDAIDIEFWRAVLGYTAVAPDNGIDPLGNGSTVWMQDLDAAKPLKHAMHIDVSVAREHALARLDAAVAAKNHIVDASNAPGSWILADRSGNKVCIAAWPDGAGSLDLADEASTPSD